MFDGLDTSVQPLFVDAGMLPAWASQVRPHLEKMAAGSGGRYLATDILTAIAAGRMQLWLAVRGTDLLCVMVTAVEDYPRLRAMRMIGLVGSGPRQWRHLLVAIEATAKRDFGCDKMEAFHIPRFSTILPGYRVSHWFAEKPL